MKRIITIMLLLALCLVPMQAMAKEERCVAVWSADSISTITGSEFVHVNIYEKGEGLYTVTGNAQVYPLYGSLDSPDYYTAYYFEVFNSNALNSHALIDSEDRTLIPYAYSDFEIISKEWVAAITLEHTTTEPYDYSNGFFGSGPEKYIIKWVDIYYMPNKAKVGCLTRAEYKQAEAWRDYLLVEDRSKNLQLYDKNFNKLQTTFDSIYDCPFYIDNSNMNQGTLRSRLTGETIGKGYSHVKLLENTDYLTVSGKRAGVGVVDFNGNIIMPLEYDDVGYKAYEDGRYVIVSRDNYKGLYDLKEKKLILPCEYDEILYDYDHGYVFNGYIGVVKNEKIGYVNMDNQITCPIKYSKNAVINLGCVAYASSLEGYQLIAADGVVTTLNNIAELSEYGCSPSGYFLRAKNHEGLWGVIDWHGETVINFHSDYSSTFEFINDEYLIYNGNNDTVYQLIK